MKGLNTQCQPAFYEPRVVCSTWPVPGPVQGAAASGRTVTAAHKMRSRRATSAHQRHGRPRRRSSAARDVSGCRRAGATSMIHVAAYRKVHQALSPPTAVGSRALRASRAPHPPLKRDVWEERALRPHLADVSGRRFRGRQKEPARSAQNTGRSKTH